MPTETATASRSPKCPRMPLAEAITFARKLYSTEKRTVVPFDVAAKAIGYGGLNGASKTVLGTLRQYGLAMYKGQGVGVSELGLRILLPSSDQDDSRIAMKEAALTPPIFSELYRDYPEASDEAMLRFLVIQRGFLEQTAKAAISAYRDNEKFLDATQNVSQNVADAENVFQPPNENPAESTHDDTKNSACGSDSQSLVTTRYQLSRDVAAEVRFFGKEITPKHIELLRQHLELTKAAFELVDTYHENDSIPS